MGTMVSFLMGKAAASMELMTHLQLVLKLRIRSYTPALLLIGLHGEKRDITFTFML
jgi:hypothetical protein